MITWKCREIEVQKFYSFFSSEGHKLSARVVKGSMSRRFIRKVLLGLEAPARASHLTYPVKFTCPPRAMNSDNTGKNRHFLKISIVGRESTNPCYMRFSRNRGIIPSSLVYALNQVTEHLSKEVRSQSDEEDDKASGSVSVRSEQPSTGPGTDQRGETSSDGGRTPSRVFSSLNRKKRKGKR